jgi:hypothetical protein
MQGALAEPLLGPAPESEDRKGFRKAIAGFSDTLAQREPFKPVSRDAFLRRFVDVPMHVHEKVYLAAVALALDHLKGAKPSPPPVAGAESQPYTLQGG